MNFPGHSLTGHSLIRHPVTRHSVTRHSVTRYAVAPHPTSAGRVSRWITGLVVLAVPLATMCTLLVLGAQPAAANPRGPNDPFGKVEKVSAGVPGSVHFVGWAADPDSTGNVGLFGLTDGRWALSPTTAATTEARPDIATKYHTGATPGFDISVRVPTTGVHTVCIAVRNIGKGMSRILSCYATPLGTVLNSAQKLARSPRGVVSTTSASTSAMHVTGWASEPDFNGARITVVLYVDGKPALTAITHAATATQRSRGAGSNGAFDIRVPAAYGSHLGCVYVVNTGLGSNTSLGCRAIDTRGRPGSGAVKTPAANTQALKEAIRHIGQRYVWAAEGPKTFDCSGLVMYSYGKAGVTTPRIAADQFAAARLIPASRAVPGDLVFYHDSVGAVYHVGIYVAPNDTVAAIDTAEGIGHQPIWAPSATYGSFTHI